MPPEPKYPNLNIERELQLNGFTRIAGVDEVGRGAWAGPVMAAAAILPPELPANLLNRLDDSKKLTPAQRNRIAAELKQHGTQYGIGRCEPERIDLIGILQATAEAMRNAVRALGNSPDYLLVDAMRHTLSQAPQKSIIRGDSISCSIAAASIIAKVERDRYMAEILAARHPQYAFDSHKGYGTAEHSRRLHANGPSPAHRLSFKPVAQAASQ